MATKAKTATKAAPKKAEKVPAKTAVKAPVKAKAPAKAPVKAAAPAAKKAEKAVPVKAPVKAAAPAPKKAVKAVAKAAPAPKKVVKATPKAEKAPEKAKFKAAFIFVAPETDYKAHKALIETSVIELSVVGVKTYKEAVKVATDLVAKGIGAIELCAGFGNEGTALITKAVKGKAVVGAVKFDKHPGFGFKSGDEIF